MSEANKNKNIVYKETLDLYNFRTGISILDYNYLFKFELIDIILMESDRKERKVPFKNLEHFADYTADDFLEFVKEHRKRGVSHKPKNEHYVGIHLYNSSQPILAYLKDRIEKRFRKKRVKYSVSYTPALVNINNLKDNGFYPIDVGGFTSGGYIEDISIPFQAV